MGDRARRGLLLAASCISHWHASEALWRDAVAAKSNQAVVVTAYQAVHRESLYYGCLFRIASSFRKEDLEGSDVFYAWCDGQTATWCPRR
jgi:hypothetical protein